MSFHKLDAERFNGLIDRLRQAGFADDDIAWSESVSEPDTAEAFAFETVSVICYAGLRHLAGQSGLRSTTVDLLLWRACSEQILDPHTGVINLPQEMRHEA